MEMSRYEGEASPPAGATLQEGVRFLFDEIQRRAYQSTKGLTADQVNHEMGAGSWSIGAILTHQLRLVIFITNTLKEGSLEKLPPGALGEEGNWDVAAILEHRERLNEAFRRVWAETPLQVLMETRPELPPTAWAEWPVLMRVLRPLTDLSTHVGQVNYVRRQLGNPVGKY
jgi:uncharacterized damage-inducible protein DinB